MRIVQRYLLRELVANATFTFVVISSLIGMLIFSIVALKQSVSTLAVLPLLQMVGLLCCIRLDIVIPLTTLVATIFTYGRAQEQRELAAMRGGGIGLFHLLMPALFVGAIACVGLVFIQDRLLPEAHYEQRLIGKRHFADNIGAVFADSSHSISDKRFKCSWGMEDRDEDGFIVLRDIVVSETRDGSPRITRAREAHPTFQPSTGVLELRLVGLVRGDEMSGEEVRVHIDLRAISEESPPSWRTANRSYAELLVLYRRYPDQEWGRKGLVEFHRRLATSFAAFLFAALGAPLGMLLRIGNRAAVFAVGFTAVLALHYAPMALGIMLGESGALPPSLAPWIGCGLVLGLTIPLIRIARQR